VHPITGKGRHPLEFKAEALGNGRKDTSGSAARVYCPHLVSNNAGRRQGGLVRHPRTPRPLFEFNRATGNDHLGEAARTLDDLVWLGGDSRRLKTVRKVITFSLV
jgi:hypothetical protein